MLSNCLLVRVLYCSLHQVPANVNLVVLVVVVAVGAAAASTVAVLLLILLW